MVFSRYSGSSANKTYRHDITGILLKVALNTITHTLFLSDVCNFTSGVIVRLLASSVIGRGLEPVLAVDDRHVAFCEYNGSVARIICVATLSNEKLLERAPDNDLLLCRKSTSNKTRYRQ